MSAPRLETLVLDAAPLLSLSPLRGIAKKYVTIPQVIAELRDQRAREHFQKLGLVEGVDVEVRNPDPVAFAKVCAAAKKSGDYSVLSRTDLLVLSLTCSLAAEYDEKNTKEAQSTAPSDLAVTPSAPESGPGVVQPSEASEYDGLVEEITDSESEDDEATPEDAEPLQDSSNPEQETLPDVSALSIVDIPEDQSLSPSSSSLPEPETKPVFEDPPSEDDGEGEWITPDNVASFKAKEMFTVDGSSKKGKGKEDQGPLGVACMTADYAMQNVLLHMGLNLVGLEGKKITNIKSWVLRCHACFKLCKDSSKKFCPSCGNPTLLRTSVSTIAPPPGSPPGTPPTVQVHLKKNFQYRNRGTIYSIPAPKAGSAKGGIGSTNLILREDQAEFQRGMREENVRARKEEKRMKSALAATGGGVDRSWADPDWMPDMILGKTGSNRRGSALPDIGYGRKNPNERRKKR